jgi:hypothetical protein
MPEENKSQVTGNDITESQRLILDQMGGMEMAAVLMLSLNEEDDRPYYLGIFTWDGPALDGQPQQNRLIGQLSRMIYDAMKGEK